MTGRTRRGDLLASPGSAAVALVAGCGGSSTVSYPEETTGGGTAAPSATADATATATPTESPTPTATATATATPTRAQVPPPGSLRLVSTDLDVRRSDHGGRVRPSVRLRNVGEVTFGLLELRFDVYYTPLGGDDDDRRLAASGYGSRAFGDDGGFAPEETATVEADLRFDRGSRADGSAPESRLDFTYAYRRVRYR
ncbi:hypothetical protein ACFQL9_17455 [Halobaculum lipolyticum]|uniref:DUF4352 domain-containing protein n=1 Tax=Halobaculum lipolyticum TaxID=3032001 RepID=A0ABD5WH15_9EURY